MSTGATPPLADMTAPNLPSFRGTVIPKKLILIVALIISVALAIAVGVSDNEAKRDSAEKAEQKRKGPTPTQITEHDTGKSSFDRIASDQRGDATAIKEKIDKAKPVQAQLPDAKVTDQALPPNAGVNAAVGAKPNDGRFVTAMSTPDIEVRVATAKPETGTLPPVPNAVPRPAGAPLPAAASPPADPEVLAAQADRIAARKSKMIVVGSEGQPAGAIPAGTSVGAGVTGTGNSEIDALVRDARQRVSQAGAASDPAAVMKQLEAVRGAAGGGAQSQAPSAAARAEDWLKAQGQGGQGQGDGEVLRRQRTLGDYVVNQGTIIPAVLLTEVSSDMPGMLTAVVQTNIYDSVDGRVLMIPKGSRLVGAYASGANMGQEKVMAAFSRLYYPDGTFINLGNMQAADAIGQSGIKGEVNNHFWQMFGASFLIAGLSRLFTPNDQVTTGGGVGSVFGQPQTTGSTHGQILTDISKKVLDRNTNIPPTIVIPKGERFNVFVSKDMSLPAMR